MPAFAGAHTTLPVLGVDVPEFAKDEKGKTRDFVFIVNESLRNECTEEARQMVYVVDITDEKNPFTVANYQVAEESGDFCSRGGRFGAHASNEYQPSGVRQAHPVLLVVQRRRARGGHPRSVPPEGDRLLHSRDHRARPTSAASRRRPAQRCKIAIQTNNVEVDNRGYIYAVDRADTGVHILELTGRGARAWPTSSELTRVTELRGDCPPVQGEDYGGDGSRDVPHPPR